MKMHQEVPRELDMTSFGSQREAQNHCETNQSWLHFAIPHNGGETMKGVIPDKTVERLNKPWQ